MMRDEHILVDPVNERTLSLVIAAALHTLHPKAGVRVEHSLDDGLYCEFDNIRCDDVLRAEMEAKVTEIIDQKQRIERRYMDREAAAQLFARAGMEDKAANIRHSRDARCPIDRLCGLDDHMYGDLPPHAGILPRVYVRQMMHGLWFGFHGSPKPQDKLLAVYDAFERWGRRLGINNVPQLNAAAKQEGIDTLIAMSEAQIERQLVKLADTIVSMQPLRRFVLISGPSSAGKTTFSRRLKIHLRILGFQPQALSMDDFFRDCCEYPRLADGSYDLESPKTLELPLLSETVKGLLAGKEMPIPSFHFAKGCREWKGRTMRLRENDILIMEGIHGLNPLVAQDLAQDELFRIYVNALTHLNLDAHTRIPTKDYRLIRRLVRDRHSRGCSAAETLRRFPRVREGEERYIYPYQENADVIFNTSMLYEMLILAPLASRLLAEIGEQDEMYDQAQRLLSLLQYVDEADGAHVPGYSILAEFTGSSVFE